MAVVDVCVPVIHEAIAEPNGVFRFREDHFDGGVQVTRIEIELSFREGGVGG